MLNNITEDGIATVMEELGIKTEIDLRNRGTSTQYEKAESPLEGTINYVYNSPSAKQYGDFITNPTYALPYLRVFTKAENYPILFHCRGGADRTGSLAFILNALCGVSEADLIKDYELTTNRFIQGYQESSTKFYDTPSLFREFHKLEGDTPAEKARSFCRNAGLTDEEIDTIISLMTGSIEIENAPKAINIGDTVQLNVLFDPENTPYRNVTWTSSDPAVAKVIDDSGTIEAVNYGRVTITATTDGGLKAKCTFNVHDLSIVEAADLNGDGDVTVWDVQLLVNANAGKHTLTDEQWERLNGMTPQDIVDYIVGKSS